MRLPIIPLVIAVTLLGGVWYLFNATRPSRKTLDVPRLTRLSDVDGIETEVAVSPDGSRLAVVASGDLWVVNLSTGERRRMTQTEAPESFPSWTPDGKKVAFTRGKDTLAVDPGSNEETMLRPNTTSLCFSPGNRIAFVRNRALWVANSDGREEKKLVAEDSIPDVDILEPHFSPDALQIAFIKTQLSLRGEVWLADVSTGMSRPLVADRLAENPTGVGWINDGQDVAYLTNRAGAYSMWYVDLAHSTINPLTQPLMTVPLARIGFGVSKDRLVMPRHFVASRIALSDGTTVASTQKLQYQPASSPDGRLIAYTLAEENKSEIWTAGADGANPTFRTLGREPRFSANGFEIVYTHTDLSGNDDVWKLDIRNGTAGRVTDADEIDTSPDWSPDGHAIAFASSRGGAVSVWTAQASGGKRLRINDGGYAPRYSPDSKSILFWNRQALWTMDADGKNARQATPDVSQPLAAVWSRLPKGPAFYAKPPVDYPVWPAFDMLPDGRFVVAPLDIRETALWAIDLTYKEK
jgi:Tol biopolymer transport system component